MRRLFGLKLEGKCWLYMGLVLAAMAICTYLWISWREKVLLYVQTAKIYRDTVLDDWEKLALDAQQSGDVGAAHALSSFPKPYADYYWRVIRRDATSTDNLPRDTFELDALDAFDNASAVEDLEDIRDQFDSFEKGLRGPKEPELLRIFLASLRRPRTQLGLRTLARAFNSSKAQRRLRTVLSFTQLGVSDAAFSAFWDDVESRVREDVFEEARQEAVRTLYAEADRQALIETLTTIEPPGDRPAIKEVILATTLHDPAALMDTLANEMAQKPLRTAVKAIRESPDEPLEALVDALADQNCRNLVEALFARQARETRRRRMAAFRESDVSGDEEVFEESREKAILDEVRALFRSDVSLPAPKDVMARLQTPEGLDVVGAMVGALSAVTNATLADRLTLALAEPAGLEVVAVVDDAFARGIERARKDVRKQALRIIPAGGGRLRLLNAQEAFQYLSPIRVTPECIACHRQDGFVPGQIRAAMSVSFPWKPEPREIGLTWNRRAIAASLSVIILSTLVALYILIRVVMIGPLQHLRNTAERIAEGDLTAKSDVATGDELEDFSEAFNKMVEGLRESQAELRALNRDLDERLNELGFANLQLFEANRLKSEFLANVSHELRTPLNSIIGFSEILQQTSAGPVTEKQRRYLTNVFTSGKHLLRLINEILDLAKIESGRLSVTLTPVSVRSTIIEVVSMFPHVQERLSVQVQAGPDLPEVQTDEGKLKQILFNLIGNAVKFTPDGGQVKVKANAINDRVQIAVADTGIGIRPEDQEVIFEKFRQVDGSPTRKFSGTGLGLSITNELVKLLGGDIQVESELGKGSTFIVSLPIDGPQSEDGVRS